MASLKKTPQVLAHAIAITEQFALAFPSKKVDLYNSVTSLLIMGKLTGSLIAENPNRMNRLAELSVHLKSALRNTNPECDTDLLSDAADVWRYTKENKAPEEGPDLSSNIANELVRTVSTEKFVELRTKEITEAGRIKLSTDERLAACFYALALSMRAASSTVTAPVAFRLAMEAATHEVVWGHAKAPRRGQVKTRPGGEPKEP